MRLPMPIVKMRSAAAQLLGMSLRALEPVFLRLARFCYEVRARSLLRGRIAPGVQFVGPIIEEGTGNVHIGAHTRIGRRTFFETYGDARITIGEHVTINDGVVITAHAGVTIGNDSMIGEYVSIRDANHGTRKDTPVRTQVHEAEPVSIGKDVWIGRGVIVAKGAYVHDGAVVGANSVVTGDVPPDAVVAGAPARPIGEREA